MKSPSEDFDRIVRPVERQMMQTVWHVLGDVHDAEDALQDALTIIVKRWKRVAQHINPRALIVKICTECAYDHLRRKLRQARRYKKLDELNEVRCDGGPTDELSQQELQQQIMFAISKLSRNQAVAFLLRSTEEQSYDDIAAALGCSVVTARKHVGRSPTPFGLPSPRGTVQGNTTVKIRTEDDDRVDEIVRNALCQPMPQAVERQLHQCIETAQGRILKQQQETRTRRHREWRYALPLVAAAVLVVAALSWLVAPRSSFAFADVQAAIRKISTVAGKVHYPNAPQNDERGYLSADHKTMRAELPGGLAVVMSPNGQRLLLNTRDKVAQLGPGTFPADDDTVRHTLLELANVEQTAVRPLGVKEIDGRKLVGFVVPSGQRPRIDLRSSIAKRLQIHVWVDPATHLPVMMEQVPLDPTDALAKVYQLITTYELNTPLDSSVFSMTPPAGYRLLKEGEKFPLPPPVLPKGFSPDSLVVNPKQGIGNARFGMSLDEVIDAVGSPDWIVEGREPTPEQEKLRGALKQKQSKDSAERLENWNQLDALYDAGKLTGWYLSYRSLGFQLEVDQKNGLQGMMCFGYADPAPSVPAPYMGYFVILNRGDSFGAGVMRPFAGRTAEGITVNSTPDEVIAAYGKPTDTTEDKNAKWLIYTEHAERERLVWYAFVDGKINNMYFVAEKHTR